MKLLWTVRSFLRLLFFYSSPKRSSSEMLRTVTSSIKKLIYLPRFYHSRSCWSTCPRGRCYLESPSSSPWSNRPGSRMQRTLAALVINCDVSIIMLLSYSSMVLIIHLCMKWLVFFAALLLPSSSCHACLQCKSKIDTEPLDWLHVELKGGGGEETW